MSGCIREASWAGPWRALQFVVHLLQPELVDFTLLESDYNKLKAIPNSGIIGSVGIDNKSMNLFLNIGIAPEVTHFLRTSVQN